MTESSANPVLVLCRDLMFASKIRAAASDSTAIKLLRDPAQLIGESGGTLIVDLSQEGALEAASSWKSANAASRLIGFVAHVDHETAARAQAKGFDDVFTRRQFVEMLPQLIRGES